MIISYFQTTDNSEAQKFHNKENVYLDLCSSVIPFTKREKGSLVFALINQKQISKVVVPNISGIAGKKLRIVLDDDVDYSTGVEYSQEISTAN